MEKSFEEFRDFCSVSKTDNSTSGFSFRNEAQYERFEPIMKLPVQRNVCRFIIYIYYSAVPILSASNRPWLVCKFVWNKTSDCIQTSNQNWWSKHSSETVLAREFIYLRFLKSAKVRVRTNYTLNTVFQKNIYVNVATILTIWKTDEEVPVRIIST